MVTRFGLAPRRAGLSIGEFQAHWHDKHGPLVRKFKGVRRIWQNHALLRESTPLLPWTGFDSCAELDFDDLAAMRFAMSEANYPHDLHADTPHMVDMTKAAPMPTERIHIAGAIDLRNVRLLTFMRRASGRAQAELNEALRALPQASQARAREIFIPLEPLDPKVDSFDAVDAQWFETPEQAERYVVSAEAGEHRCAIAHLVHGVERLIARVRVIL